MAEHSLISYDELSSAASTYGSEAEAIREIKKNLQSLNENLTQFWQNDTATQFAERFNSEYGPSLEQTAEALDSIKRFIDQYVTDHRELDERTARSIGV